MKLISVNVGKPQTVEYNGDFVSTAIFKTAVAGKVKLSEMNLEGDKQADLRYHGGWSKAVYAYPHEHYDFWRTQLPETDLTFGNFGENFTTTGLDETEINIGDKIRFGECELVVTEPRMPCSKLNVRFGRADIVKRFQKSKRCGIYFMVTKTGEVAANDAIEITERNENKVSITEVSRLRDAKQVKSSDVETLRRAVEINVLPDEWKKRFRGYLSKIEG
ncbi:MAG: MOSC domain-containing protein [Pyrinomonadaceae bacterium]|nr:MOSC domain-containing protein [Pyrinomonadaceae bacterium]